MSLTPLDKLIGVFSPKTAAERGRWRVMMNATQHYDAAGRTRRTKGWKAPTGDGNSATRYGSRLRNVARDMQRNNAIIRTGVKLLVDHIVGDGIIPNVVAENEDRQKRLQQRLLAFTDTVAADSYGRMNLYGLQRQAVECLIVTGEVLWRRRPRFPEDGLPLPFQIEAMEPEFIDDRHTSLSGQTTSELDGIAFDALNRRRFYRLYSHHPEALYTGYPESALVAANQVIHLYRADRPGQRRGVTWLAPAIPLAADAYESIDATLLRQKIAALWAVFTKDTMADGPSFDQQQNLEPMSLQPGMVEHLPPGRDIEFADPPKTDGFGEHTKLVLRLIARSLDLSYEELSGDLEGVTFSSARLGRIPMRSAISAVQWTLVIPTLLDPLANWLREAMRQQHGETPDWSIKWTPPGFPMADPAREIPPLTASIAAGLTSRQRAIREAGYDPEDINREIAEDVATANEIGVTFDRSPAPPVPEPTTDR